ncbi:sensor domain-containing diguanylate cyclase [Marinomonas hwangdonensis]|uniref:diguanylate cyclase n=1 Tax=Marinomonas hwangdonensis TaxID=1053647 RepID=A0A3M8QCV1_9GAMM|nr:GGDEF domain-containing protein [Marinomonas hwangdonensis]RNF52884.1 sensor domain-containing diguanylate cyclase [Marinomonas hwangdonensis]
MLRGFDTFRKRITLLSGGLLLSLSFVLVTSFYQLTSTRLSNASGESLVSLSQSISNMLSANLLEREREIRLLSRRTSLYENQDLSALQDAIDEIRNSYKDYAWIGFANASGTVIASGNGILKGVDVSQRPWFIHGRSGPFVGNVHEALLLENLMPKPKDGSPIRFVDFAAPVMGENGDFKGVVATHADWSWVREVLLSSLTEASKRKGIDIFIIDNDKKILYPDSNLFSNIEVPKPLPKDGQFKSLIWQDESEYLTSLVSLNSSESSNLGWQIVLRQPLSSAMSAVKEVHTLLLFLGVFATLLCMLLAYQFASTLSRPLERLAQTAKSIQQGNRKETFQDGSQLTEIASLSRSLEEMMSSLLVREQSLMQMNLTLETKVQHRTAELEASNRSLKEAVRLDPLTHSYNRLALDEALLDEYRLAKELKRPFAVIMVDADHFKKVNDTYGHTIGDIVLQKIAKLFAGVVGIKGMVARFGGEEFTVLLPDTGGPEAKDMAEMLREAIEKEEMTEGLYITASFGVALYEIDDNHYEQVLNRADSALYKAKETGRNQVVMSNK